MIIAKTLRSCSSPGSLVTARNVRTHLAKLTKEGRVKTLAARYTLNKG